MAYLQGYPVPVYFNFISLHFAIIDLPALNSLMADSCIPFGTTGIKGQDPIRCCELGAEVQDQEKVFQTLIVCLLIAFANCGAPFRPPLLATNTYYDQLFYSLNLKECFAPCQSAMI